MAKILITGGAGFIGSACAKKLMDRGDQVVLLDNFNDYYDPKLKKDRIKIYLKGYKFKLYKGDIRDEKFLERVFRAEKIDKIIHLAAMAGVRYSLENPKLYADTNVLGSINLLNMAVKYKIKNFVFSSSSSVYGNSKKLIFCETDQVDLPISPYAATKKSGELIAHVYSHIHSLNVSMLRYFTVYGPWGRPDMAPFKFTKNIIEGRTIDVYNHGKMLRDFTYIDDIVSGTICALDNPQRYEIINVGGNKPENLMKFIEAIEKAAGKKAKKKMLPMQPGDVVKTSANTKKLQKLGWKPTVRIEEGMKKVMEWYREYYKISNS